MCGERVMRVALQLCCGLSLFAAPSSAGRGSVAGDSIPFLFHYSATDSFHTTFVYDRATDSWQCHMDNDSAGVRRPFARVTLTRQPRGR
jgi:hypothetical protein